VAPAETVGGSAATTPGAVDSVITSPTAVSTTIAHVEPYSGPGTFTSMSS
jgi:hypothetical protein